jgi:hypothetical protein
MEKFLSKANSAEDLNLELLFQGTIKIVETEDLDSYPR